MQQISRISMTMLLAIQTAAFAPVHTSIHSSSALQSTAAPTQIAEGLTKQIIKSGNGPPLRDGEVATLSYTCTITDTQQIFSQSKKQKVIVGDSIMIEGWDKALSTMNVGEKATIQIDDYDKYGYGAEGIKPAVPPNARLSIEMEILDAEEQKNMGVAGVVGAGAGVTGLTGSGDLGALDPSKPRTPDAIAAAYKVMQVQMAVDKENEKEGLEGMIAKAKEFYFFGFFEGETGEKAPWYLRPSITFPIAFAVVGAGFFVTFALGGISERGRQKTDELDDIVLTYNFVKNALVVAFAQVEM